MRVRAKPLGRRHGGSSPWPSDFSKEFLRCRKIIRHSPVAEGVVSKRAVHVWIRLFAVLAHAVVLHQQFLETRRTVAGLLNQAPPGLLSSSLLELRIFKEPSPVSWWIRDTR